VKTFKWFAGLLAITVVALLVPYLDTLAAHHAVPGLLLANTVFGAPFRARSRAAVQAAATPPSGHAQEAIWHQVYDSQTYTSGATVTQTFFAVTNADKTLSNLPQGGVFPSPQSLQIHNVCCDVLSAIPVTTSATLDGVLNDLALLLMGSAQRPVWTLEISDKKYGPYSLTTLHGTGGPSGFGFSSDGAEIIQFAKNDPAGGWNYFGRVIIPEQNNFRIVLDWAAFATLSANKIIRVSMFGVLGRRVL
jgi:hypothetical protein